MKKSILIFFVLSICTFANAQFSVFSPNGYLQINDLPNIDAVFLFNGITTLTEISYYGAGTKEWREYNGTSIVTTNQPTITFSPDNATGYILYIDGTPTYWIWVFDYSLYLINNIQVAPIEQDFCKNLTLNITAPNLVYYDKNNQMKILSRKLYYVDAAFNGTVWQNDSVPTPLPIITPPNIITISAPKQDVTFIDYFAKEMNIQSSFSFDYQAVAVESHLKGTVEVRSVKPIDKPNEKDRDIPGDYISGSAPLVVEFKSRANTPVAAYFDWIVETPSRPYKYSTENIRYTFIDYYENYKVKLKVTSAYGCSCLDSVIVAVKVSYLAVPNFFTPNGDGINDEFRVAYTSIKTYKCVVFNRWGNVVFSTDNPNEGWDGNVHGRPAAEGTYYYVITATGTDIDNDPKSKNRGKPVRHDERGAVNLFR